MRFYEYESKLLLARHGVALPKGSKLARSGEEARQIAAAINGPTVLKSQVLTGGRMKAGGVLFADTPDQAAEACEKILKLEINGHKARGVLVESRQPVAQEYYLGVTWDGIAKKPVMILSDMGGIDVEEVAEKHPEHIAKKHFSTLIPFSDFRAKELVAQLATGSDVNAIMRFAAPLARIFMQYGLTLAEINPLAKLADGTFVALDAHVDMEAEARGAHKALLKELGIGDDETRMARTPTKFELEGAAINAADHRGVAGNVTEFGGTLGLIIGAGGGSLTLFDAVRNHGGDPANYCEIGGNPSVGKVANLTKLILSKPGVTKIAVMMNVVSNTRVDMVARGVIKGVIESGGDPAEKIAIFRIPGSWEQEGFKILSKYGVEYCDRTVSMYEAAGRAVAKWKGN
ncbi:MAG TPA: ATP-grasp domain-containing protein [Candidatus Limnocylindrales bacterium]|nr:ATP-grasp domain-containing protein [Candidatus Limnocylindrales bacterium]